MLHGGINRLGNCTIQPNPTAEDSYFSYVAYLTFLVPPLPPTLTATPFFWSYAAALVLLETIALAVVLAVVCADLFPFITTTTTSSSPPLRVVSSVRCSTATHLLSPPKPSPFSGGGSSSRRIWTAVVTSSLSIFCMANSRPPRRRPTLRAPAGLLFQQQQQQQQPTFDPGLLEACSLLPRPARAKLILQRRAPRALGPYPEKKVGSPTCHYPNVRPHKNLALCFS